MTKKGLIFGIILLLLAALLGVGVALAFYRVSDSGWEQTFTASTVVFKLNGKTAENFTSYDLGLLSRGDSVDLDFDISVKSKTNLTAAASYNVDFVVTGELARAIKVYRYVDGDYSYEGLLNSLTSIAGVMPLNSNVNYYYKLVYSEASSDYFEGKNFTVAVSATNQIITEESDRLFVSSVETLKQVESLGTAAVGKTVVLTGDFTLPSEEGTVTLYGVDFDLNGKSLTLNSDLKIILPEQKESVKVTNSAQKGGITGSKNLIVYCGTGKFANITNLENSYSRIDVQAADFNAIAALMQTRLLESASKTYLPGDLLGFSAGLSYYFTVGYTITPPMAGNVADESIVTGSGADWRVSSDYNKAVTAVNSVTFLLSDGISLSTSLNADIKVRGTGLAAITQSILDSVPSVLRGALFLPAYDEYSKATVTWVVDGEYLTADGRYLPFGYNGLSTWQAAEIKIGVITHSSGESYRAEKTVKVSVMNAEERTLRIYDYARPVLEEVGYVFSPYLSGIKTDLAEKAGLKDIKITVESGQSYLEVADTDFGQGLKVLALPSAGRSVSYEFTVVFYYADGEDTLSYEVKRTVTVLGYSGSVELADPTLRLMQDFESNPYIEGEGYRFYARAYTAQGANVDYFVRDAYSAYVMVQNDVFITTPDGHYVKKDGEYLFFSTAFRLTDSGEYEASADGNFILIDGSYVDISADRANGEIYDRTAQITVLPAFVPAVAHTEAEIDAMVWEETVDGEKQYLKDVDGSFLTYRMTLDIRGIYHHSDEEIADYNLYLALLEYYDIDGDGWIEVAEAATAWTDGGVSLARLPSNIRVGEQTYNYLDLSDLNISSVKGLEYFINAQGYNLSGNSVIGLDSLERLYSLSYLDLSSNLITDITSLRYLDTLGYLNLAKNRVYSVEPLRYLPGIKYLDLRYNEQITTIEPLSLYNNLAYLNILQQAELYNRSGDTVYYLALLTDANRANGFTVIRSISDGTGSDGAAPYVASDETVVAAKALSEMTVIDEVGDALNVPGSYYYEYSLNGVTYKKRYKIMWETAGGDREYLEFINTSNQTIGYTIKKPVVDRTMNIYVRVTEEGTDAAVELNRKFVLTLLPGTNDESLARIEIQPGIFRLASEVVPDSALRALLFTALNSEQEGLVPLLNADGTSSGTDTAYWQLNTLSYSEMTRANVNVNSFRDAGIKSLEGIQHFGEAIAFDLDFTGNSLDNPDDIALLSGLPLVKGITLGGQTYDFTLLSKYTSDGAIGLTGLERLDVSGCYSLSSDSVLQALYGIYLNNGAVDIYLRSSDEVWNPYENLSLYVQSLPSGFVFINMNDTADYYAGSGSFSVRFYDLNTVEFRLATDSSGNVNGTLIGTKSGNFVHTDVGVRYNVLSGYSDTVYDAVTVSGNDGSGRADIQASHFIELKIEFNHNILVVDYADNDTALDKVFPGRDLRQAIVTRLSILFNGTSAVNRESIGSGFYKEGNHYYITLATIAALSFSGTLEIDGTYTDSGASAIQGLELTSVTALKLARDANLGDGTYLSGLTTLIVTFSGVDFSLIKTDLPNLRNIYLSVNGSSAAENAYSSNRYAILYDGNGAAPYYSMKHFINLKQFVAISSNIYEWEGLNGLIGIDLEKLHIYETGDAWTNKNTRFTSTVGIVGQIYENSSAANKDYRLGSKQDATDKTALFNPSDWGADVGQVDLTQEELTEYNEFVSYIIDLGVKLNGKLHLLDTEQKLTDGQSLTLPYSAGDSFFGTDYMTGSGYSARAFSVKWRAIGITAAMASALLNVTPGAESVTAEGLPKVELPAFDTTVTSYPYDVYFILQGEIGTGYLDENGVEHAFNGTVRTFAYPVLIKGSAEGSATSNVYVKISNKKSAEEIVVPNNPFFSIAGENYLSYAAFTDIGFRFVMFTALAPYAYNNQPGLIHFSSDNLQENYLPSMNNLFLNNDAVSAQHNPAPTGGNKTFRYDLYGGNATGITQLVSLEGISSLAGLRTFRMSTNVCSDIDDISALVKWEKRSLVLPGVSYAASGGLNTFRVETNMLSNLNALKDFTGLTSVAVGNNYVNTLAAEDGTFVLKNSLSSLGSFALNNNNGLSLRDLFLLTKAVAENTETTAITSLNLNCFAISDGRIALTNEEALSVGLENLGREATAIDFYKVIISKLSGSSLQINGVTVAASDIDGFFGDMTELDNAKGYMTSGYSLDSTESILTSYTAAGGKTYKLNLLNSPNLTDALENVRGNLGYSDAFLKITDSSNSILNAVYRIAITDAEASAGARLKIGDVYYTSDNFGAGLWQYIVKNSAKMGNGVIEYNPTSFTLTSESGIDSLKGLNLFPSLTEVRISANILTELWFGAFPSLQILVLDAISMNAKTLSAIRYATELRELITARVSGINYNESFEIEDGGVTTTTTLGKIILCNNLKLDKLLINNEFGMMTYSSNTGATKSALSAVLEYVNSDNYLFNIKSLLDNGTERARKISSLSAYAVAETKTMTNFPKNVFVFNNTYHSEGAPAYVAAIQSASEVNLVKTSVNVSTSAGTVRYSSSSAINVTSILDKTMSFAFNFTTEAGREVIPSTVTEDGIKGEGVKFYLPSAVSIGGSSYSVSWNCTNEDYLTAGEGGVMLFMDRNNFASETSVTITGTITGSGNIFPRSYSKEIAIAKSEIEYTSSVAKLSPYYVELPGEDGLLHLYDAGNYFKSSRLIYWLFNSQPVQVIDYDRAVFENMNTSAIGRYYLPWSVQQSTRTLNIPNEGITTLEGLQLFKNLRSFTLQMGSVISLSPLSNMRLTSFRYVNTNGNTNYIVQDFSPLFNSRDTLTDFSYAANGGVQIDDLSFLMSFNALNNITVGVLNSSITGYENTLGFKYMASWFAINRPNVKITYNGVVVTSSEAERRKATGILSGYSVNNDTVEYVENYRLDIKNYSGGAAVFRLPVLMEEGGKVYGIRYNSLSSFLTVGDRIYRGSNFNLNADGVTATLTDGQLINDGLFAILLANTAFNISYLNGQSSVEQVISLKDGDKNVLNMAYLAARISVDGYDFERLLTVNCEENSQYPKITLPTGFGSIILPSYAEWYLTDGKNRIDFVNNAATFDGLSAYRFVISGISYTLIMLNKPLASNKTLRLEGVVSGQSSYYTLSHNFTERDISLSLSGGQTVGQKEYYRALGQIEVLCGIAEIRDILLRKLDALYAEYEEMYRAGRYAESDFTEITVIYERERTNLSAAEDYAAATKVYDAASVAMEQYKKLVEFTYSDGRGGVLATVFDKEGQSIVVADYSAELSSYGEFAGWNIGGNNYAPGDTYVLPEEDVAAIPFFVSDLKYYLTESSVTLTSDVGSMGRYYSSLYEFEERNGEFVLDNMQFVTDNATNRAVNFANVLTKYNIVAVNSVNRKIFNVASSIDMTGKTRGRYNIVYTADAVSAVMCDALFTFMGNSMYEWGKPDERLPLTYDKNSGLYFIEITAINTGTAKFMALKNGVTAASPKFDSADLAGCEYYPLYWNGAGSTTDTNFSMTKGVIYTLYFSPRVYVYDSLGFDYGQTDAPKSSFGYGETGFVVSGSENGLVKAGSGAVLFTGSFASTSATAKAMYVTDLYAQSADFLYNQNTAVLSSYGLKYSSEVVK